MMLRLDILSDSVESTSRTFHQDRVRIGASSLSDLQIQGEGVAPDHAVIELKNNQGRLLPGGDRAELRLNGTIVREPALLEPGDEIELGEVRLGYKLIPLPVPESRRRFSLLEWVALVLSLLLAGGQIFFLAAPSVSWRLEVDQELLRPTPTPFPTPAPPPGQETDPDVDFPLVPTATPMPTATPTPVPTPTSIPLPTPTSIPHTEGAGVGDLLSQARNLIRKDQDLAADRLLLQALELEPDSIPVLMERAGLFGKRAMFEQSISAWERVRELAGPASMDARNAQMEIRIMRRRMDLLDSAPAEPPPVPTDRPQLQTRPTPMVNVREQDAPVRIQNVNMERFAEGPRYDAFRLIHFDLQHVKGTPAVEAGDLQVRITFYEQVGDQVKVAEIPNPTLRLALRAGLSGGKVMEDLSGAYEVPKGTAEPDRSYYGAVIRLFINGEEVDVVSDPHFLLDLLR